MKLSENEKQLLKVKGSNNGSGLSKSMKRRLRRIRRASAPISEEVKKPEGPKLTNSAKRKLRLNKKKLKLASGDLGDIKNIDCKPTISFISTEIAKKHLAQEKKKLKRKLKKQIKQENNSETNEVNSQQIKQENYSETNEVNPQQIKQENDSETNEVNPQQIKQENYSENKGNINKIKSGTHLISNRKPKKKFKKQNGDTSQVHNSKKQNEKLSRYVLFVGNLPYSLTKEELTKHFCKTTHQPKDVRLLMQKGSDSINKGFAYVEFSNEEGYLKGLKLQHSFLGGRCINVEYSASAKDKDTKKSLIKKKTLKLKALSSSGKI